MDLLYFQAHYKDRVKGLGFNIFKCVIRLMGFKV
jgi:hypothetical protein